MNRSVLVSLNKRDRQIKILIILLGVKRSFALSRQRHNFHYYLRQHSCGKVMFSQASVILFTGLCDRHPPGRHPPGQTHPQGRHTLDRHPPGRHPPGQTAPLPSASWDTPHTQCKLGYTPCPPLQAPLQWTVRILLECILVLISLCTQFWWQWQQKKWVSWNWW